MNNETKSVQACTPATLESIAEILSGEDELELTECLSQFHPAETASLLEAAPPTERHGIWEGLSHEQRAGVLLHLHDVVLADLIESTPASELLAALAALSPVDLAYIWDQLPPAMGLAVMDQLNSVERVQLETSRAYDEGSAGKLMRSDPVRVRENVRLEVVIRYLRRHNTLPPATDALMVVDNDERYLGKLNLADLLTHQPEEHVTDVMRPNVDVVTTGTGERELALMFERRDLLSMAVVDEMGILVGRITVDDALDIIREDANNTLMHMAGLDDKDDLFAPVWESTKRRTIWLGINLVTAFLAAWVIGQFEATLQQIVALAVLMPIVASMGGIAGSQTLTLMIRGLALDQIGPANVMWLARKELGVGLLGGVLWSVVVGLLAIAWFGETGIGIVIAAAIIVNLLAAAGAGIAVPLLLKRVGADPALSGAVVLTTVTDVVGFLSFLGLATLFLLPAL